jgi:hypothetical protein
VQRGRSAHRNTPQPALSPCPPSLPTRPLAPGRRCRRLVSTSDTLAPPSRLRRDVPPPPLLPLSASESLRCCHAASRRRDAVNDPSRIPPAHTRIWLVPPRAATGGRPTALPRRIGAESIRPLVPLPSTAVWPVPPPPPLAARFACPGFSGSGIVGGARAALTMMILEPFLHLPARDMKTHTVTCAGMRRAGMLRESCAAQYLGCYVPAAAGLMMPVHSARVNTVRLVCGVSVMSAVGGCDRGCHALGERTCCCEMSIVQLLSTSQPLLLRIARAPANAAQQKSTSLPYAAGRTHCEHTS